MQQRALATCRCAPTSVGMHARLYATTAYEPPTRTRTASGGQVKRNIVCAVTFCAAARAALASSRSRRTRRASRLCRAHGAISGADPVPGGTLNRESDRGGKRNGQADCQYDSRIGSDSQPGGRTDHDVTDVLMYQI